MNINIIIVGFKYDRQEIQCVLYDIFRIYNHFSSFNYTCYVLTDIHDFTYTISMYDCIRKKQIGNEFTDFIGEIRYYPSWYKRVFNISTLEESVKSIPNSDITVVYYSGHGTNKGIQLPSSEILSYTLFRNLFVSKTSHELTLIMDCCKGNNMNLIYYMNDSCKTFRAHSTGEYLSLTITVITSSDSDQKSLANDYTSLFTKYFIEFLKSNEQRSYSSMIEFVQNNTMGHGVGKQNIKVYSSIANYPIMPSYLFGQYHVDINILDSYITFIKL